MMLKPLFFGAVLVTVLAVLSLAGVLVGFYVAILTGNGTWGGVGGFSIVPLLIFGVVSVVAWIAWADYNKGWIQDVDRRAVEIAAERKAKSKSSVGSYIS